MLVPVKLSRPETRQAAVHVGKDLEEQEGFATYRLQGLASFGLVPGKSLPGRRSHLPCENQSSTVSMGMPSLQVISVHYGVPAFRGLPNCAVEPRST